MIPAAAVLAFGLAACVPAPRPVPPSPTTTPATNPPATSPTSTAPAISGAPVISSFQAAVASGPAPVTTAFTWAVTDPNGDPLTCRIDLDGNGTVETLINNCTSSSVRSASFPTSGVQTVRFEVSDATTTSSASTTVNVGSVSADPFNITVRFNGAVTPSQENTFNSAAARWASVIKGGLPTANLSLLADDCIVGAPAFNGSVDDLMIDAQITPIDGPSGILGSAGPCWLRSGSRLPIYGVMKFDSADVGGLESSGRLEATILHEMGHVLGIGTIWQSPLFTGGGTSTPLFHGLAARGAWHAIGGTGSVPIENTGGPGTRDGHWSESTFDNELMTGWLDSGSNPLSRMTVAALGDLGYSVDMTAADPYGLPGLRSMRAFGLGDGHDHDDVRLGEHLIQPRVAPASAEG